MRPRSRSSRSLASGLTRFSAGVRIEAHGRAEFPRFREKRGLSVSPLALSRGRRRSAEEIDRPVGRAKIGDHEERSPREYRYFLGGPRDQTCNLYIAPYLPTRRADSAKVYGLFYDSREREEHEEDARRRRSASEGLRGSGAREATKSLLSLPPFLSLSQPRVSPSSLPARVPVTEERRTGRRGEEARGTIAYANYDRGSGSAECYIASSYIFLAVPAFGYLDNDGQLAWPSDRTSRCAETIDGPIGT